MICKLHNNNKDITYPNATNEHLDVAQKQRLQLLSNAYNKRGYCVFRRLEWWKCVNDNTKAIEINPLNMEAYRDRAEVSKCIFVFVFLFYLSPACEYKAYDCLNIEDARNSDKNQFEVLRRKYLSDKITNREPILCGRIEWHTNPVKAQPLDLSHVKDYKYNLDPFT